MKRRERWFRSFSVSFLLSLAIFSSSFSSKSSLFSPKSKQPLHLSLETFLFSFRSFPVWQLRNVKKLDFEFIVSVADIRGLL